MAEISSIEGKETASIYAPTTQVYKATHDRDGNRLPYRYRSFISFSFGEKLIEDFGFVAVTDGDRLNKEIYSNFDDITETHETLDGQVYWGTHLTNNRLNLTLATDGITARQLDEFKQWFAPGKVRELILMEHPNRAIMARVSEVPQFSMLPFSTQTSVKILGQKYSTEVTLFKGEISLSFVMDEPYWYAKNNIIYPFMVKGGANGIINIDDDPYRLKDLLEKEFKIKDKKMYIEFIESNVKKYRSALFIDMDILEEGYWEIYCKLDDGEKYSFAYPSQNEKRKKKDWDREKIIPIITQIYGGAFTALTDSDNNAYIQTDIDSAKDYAKIILEDNIPHLQMIQDNILLGENIGASNDAESKVFNDTNNIVGSLDPWTGAHVTYYGYVAYDDMVSWTENVEIYNGSPQYLFYSGTAPSKPTLQFTFSPTFDNNGYINLPRNSYSDSDIVNTRNYNYIAFDDHKFYFTTPSLITGYNQAVSIVKKYKVGYTLIDLITNLKESINEYYARAWAIFCARSLENNTTYVNSSSGITVNFASEFVKRMKYLICTNGTTPNSITCFFDSKHGTATVTYSAIRKADGEHSYNSNVLLVKDEVQNAGDMVKSDYLIIEGRNYPSFNGYITKEECHIIQTNFSSLHPLTGLLVTFQNMYY